MENDLIEERNNETYKETMNIDIEKIQMIENRHKVYTKQWRKIYEVIQKYFLMKLTSFRMIV